MPPLGGAEAPASPSLAPPMVLAPPCTLHGKRRPKKLKFRPTQNLVVRHKHRVEMGSNRTVYAWFFAILHITDAHKYGGGHRGSNLEPFSFESNRSSNLISQNT